MKPSSSKLTQSQVKMYSFVDSAISDMDGANAIVVGEMRVPSLACSTLSQHLTVL